MTNIAELIAQLSARLPELEWKLKQLDVFIQKQTLSYGLFQNNEQMSTQSCIDEIKHDLRLLKRYADQTSAFFMAKRIEQKINALVHVCRLKEATSNDSAKQNRFDLNMMTTRQQWIQTIQEDIDRLYTQRTALLNRLAVLEKGHHPEEVLNLRVELGTLEKQLTKAKEALGEKIDAHED